MFPPPTEREQIDQRYCLSQVASLFAGFCATVTSALEDEAMFQGGEHVVGTLPSKKSTFLLPKNYDRQPLLQSMLNGFGLR